MINPNATYAIVIPAVDNSAKCRDLLETLLMSISDGYYDCPVVICWDNVSEGTIRFFENKYKWITSLPYLGDRNLNFCKNSNRGLRYVYEELHLGAFLVNMDTCLPHRTVLERVINMGISSPKAVHVDGDHLQKIFQLNQMADPACPCNKGAPGNEKTPSNRFAGFCMWISKYAFSKIGYLDENTFVASFEDDDYCVRACLAELPCETTNIPVHHELKDRTDQEISTTGAYNMNSLVEHQGRFMRKWSIPQGIPHDQFANFILKHRKWNDSMRVN